MEYERTVSDLYLIFGSYWRHTDNEADLRDPKDWDVGLEKTVSLFAFSNFVATDLPNFHVSCTHFLVNSWRSLNIACSSF